MFYVIDVQSVNLTILSTPDMYSEKSACIQKLWICQESSRVNPEEVFYFRCNAAIIALLLPLLLPCIFRRPT